MAAPQQVGRSFEMSHQRPKFASYHSARSPEAGDPYGYSIDTIYDRMLELNGIEHETSQQDDGSRTPFIARRELQLTEHADLISFT